MIKVEERTIEDVSSDFERGDGVPEVSVIVIVTERPESLVDIYREHAAVLRDAGYSYEFIVAAHPYFRELLEPLEELAAAGEPIRTIESGRSIGETALLRSALPETQGRITITLPAYRQVEATALRGLLEGLEAGADLTIARRWPRRDALINRIQNRALHLLLGSLGSDRIHDVACGVRAARREVLEQLPLYGDFLRFLPLLAIYNGYQVEEVATPQHPNDTAGRIYGPGVYLRRLIDVFGLFFLLRFTDKPLRFFGLLGSAFAIVGSLLLAILLIQRVGGEGIGGRPLLLLAVLLTVLGVQAIALGLIGEMIVHFNAGRARRYRVKAGDRAHRRASRGP